MKLHLILSVALLATAGAASAQTVPHPGACKADASKLCPDAVAAMDRTAVQACLTQKIAQVSPDCKANMAAMKQANAAATAAPTSK
ncbi:hypothetical protein EUV02_05230 [Polymorphobacter arshaanensis]|uniref:Cysteine rich repeat-containing protein n=1 Tax=Glacieibacterium arshaanense TaxID=2511025 RepID=A0A4Y9ET89_9SPHN|nr:hypothetical protein [Polymorphobacter arshaanensis]TFU06393.1 hypothetical protein EUV02_05230 [Polymorphobacter arshaanensis]